MRTLSLILAAFLTGCLPLAEEAKKAALEQTNQNFGPEIVKLTVDTAGISNSEWCSPYQGGIPGIGHLPVADNNPAIYGAQSQQSGHWRLYLDGGTIPDGRVIEPGELVHAAEVIGYWPSAEDPQVYLMRSGGFYTNSGHYIAICNFAAGVDSYMSPTLTLSAPSRYWETTDGTRGPLLDIGEWAVVPIHDGQWWPGEAPHLKPDIFTPSYPYLGWY